MTVKTAPDIISFWFQDGNSSKWFSSDPSFDQVITELFLPTYHHAKEHKRLADQDSSTHSLALTILFDQFPRNMFRNTHEAFATDELARDIARLAIKKGYDIILSQNERKFLYMPFMHSEAIAEQEYAVGLYHKLGDTMSEEFAKKHRDIIARFGRFPHRNEALGRHSTQEELEFLKEPGSSF